LNQKEVSGRSQKKRSLVTVQNTDAKIRNTFIVNKKARREEEEVREMRESPWLYYKEIKQ
jgi:hypothetical protein